MDLCGRMPPLHPQRHAPARGSTRGTLPHDDRQRRCRTGTREPPREGLQHQPGPARLPIVISVRRVGTTAATVVTLLVTTSCGVVPGLGPGGLQTLAKVDGWRAGFDPPPNTFAVLEVAYDVDTARRMWAENIPADLPERSGDPRDPGRYGELDDVDLDQQAVALWSGGESGSCPGWISSVALEDGAVVVTRDADEGRGCSDDYNPFRVLVVVDRSALPTPEALSGTEARTDNPNIATQVVLTAYP